ncbi:MAG: ROK family protein [Candidatus Pacebacteria bacterium]|nr:ROK family protein [Candidatus Paceibacterota bacterium]
MANILGVDIGGSKIKMVLWDGEKVLKEWKSETANLENLKKGLDFFNRSSGSPTSANFKVGIGLPGLLDFKNNKALFCKNLPQFNNVNLKACFPAGVNPNTKQSYGVGVKVDNDAKCFLRAEIFAIAGKKPENILGVVFGTGIGGAVSISNFKSQIANIYYGRDGWAGEFGHMIIDKNKSWEYLYQQTKNKPKEQEKINAIGLANLINIFNPELIILGGKGANLLSAQGVKLLASYLLTPKKQMPRFIKAKLKDNSVAIGAAMLWS